MRCPRCKSVVTGQDRFCRQCGGPVGSAGHSWATGAPEATLSTGRRSSRGGKVVGAALLYLAMGAGSGVAAHGLLAWRAGPQGGAVTLGTPRLVVLTPASQATVPDAAASPAPAPGVRRRPRARPRPRPPGREPSGAVLPPSAPAPAPEPPPPAKPPVSKPEVPAEKQAKPPEDDPVDRFRAGLNAESVRMVVRHHLPQVRACYDRALKQQAGVGGIVEIRFAIQENGQVGSASVHRNTTGHEGLGKCLAMLIKSWRFPKPVGGAMEFVYPFVFSAGE
jgi:TonB family protein